MNKGRKIVYIISMIISISIIIIGALTNDKFSVLSSILISIGCSVLSSILLAVFIEIKDSHDNIKKIKYERQMYFRRFYDELKMLLQRFLWYDKRMNEGNFDWSLDTEEYVSLSYMQNSWSKYTDANRDISFDDAIVMIKEKAKKYSHIEFQKMPQKKQQDVIQMFFILFRSSKILRVYLNEMCDNKLLIKSVGYLSLNELETMLSTISMGLTLFTRDPLWNYEEGINELCNEFCRLRKIGNYNDNLVIGLQGSI